MGTSSISVMFDVLITAFGIYILYTGFRMKTTREIKGGMFLPQGVDPEKCLDKDYLPAVRTSRVCGRLPGDYFGERVPYRHDSFSDLSRLVCGNRKKGRGKILGTQKVTGWRLP